LLLTLNAYFSGSAIYRGGCIANQVHRAMHQERAKDKARRLPYTVHSYHRCEAHRGNTGVCYVCVTSLKHWQLLTQMWYRTDVLLGDRRHNEGMRVAEAMPTTASRNTCTRLEGRLRNMRVADPTRRRRLASCEELRLPVGIQPQRMKLKAEARVVGFSQRR